jgi:hypothetical protein
VGSELLLGIKSRFDGSGAEGATRGIGAVEGAADRASSSAKRMAGQFAELEIRQRRVETATRVIGTEFANMAAKGFSVASAADAGAGALSFLGNAVRFASGPIGIAVTVATSLAAALLSWKANAEQAKQKTEELMSATQALASARSILLAQGRTEEDATVERLKEMEAEAKASGDLTAMMAGRSAAQVKLNEALDRERTIREQLEVVRLRGRAQTDYEKAAYGEQYARAEQGVRKLESAFTTAAAETGKARDELQQYDDAIDRATGAVKDMAPPMERLIDLSHSHAKAVADDLNGAARAWDDYADYVVKENKDLAAKEFQIRMTSYNNAASILGSMAALIDSSTSDELEVVKGLNAAEAVAHSIVAAMQAYKLYGPTPAGYIAAGAMLAQGAASVAAIYAVKKGGNAPPSLAAPPASAPIGPAVASPVGQPVGTPVGSTGSQTGAFGGTLNLTVNVRVTALDPESIPKATLRRLADTITDMVLFRIHGQSGKLAFG